MTKLGNTQVYKWNAECYQKSPSETQEWGRELVSKLELGGWERVLDIGCGDGKLTAEIAQRVPQGSAVGIDSSPEMISLAKRTFPPRQFANLHFQQMDATHLGFSSELDVVFSNAALHWIADHRPMLKGIQRSLRSPGKMLIQMGGTGNAAEIIATTIAVAQDARWRECFAGFSSPVRFYGPEEYGALLAEAGLEPRRVELIAKDMLHHGKEGLASWVRAVWLPFVGRIPDSLREDFIAAIADSYVNSHPMDDAGFIHIRMVRLEVEAEKW
ncbi:MAG: methyltransferase domain-containing protein [Dehalococcoidia bacterium]